MNSLELVLLVAGFFIGVAAAVAAFGFILYCFSEQ
jgi:hypothetical protein